MEFLSKVVGTFQIQGRGLVLIPEEPKTDFRIRVGTALDLRTPDGRSMGTRITGVELLKPMTGRCRMGILITRDINNDQVPVGTEIWYHRDDPSSHPSGSQPA